MRDQFIHGYVGPCIGIITFNWTFLVAVAPRVGIVIQVGGCTTPGRAVPRREGRVPRAGEELLTVVLEGEDTELSSFCLALP